jgi:drug/metabolite transporter (DMT)-like permease
LDDLRVFYPVNNYFHNRIRKKQDQSRFNPRIILIIGVIAVSIASIIIKLIDAPPLVIATYRLGISASIMLLLSGKDINQLKKLNSREHLAIIIAGLFLCLHFASWITSLRFTTIASSVIIVDSSPLFVVLFSRLFLREKTSRYELFGIILSIFGAVIIVSSHLQIDRNIFGDSLALIGAVTVAVYLIIGRSLRNKLNTFPYAASVYGVSFLFLFMMTLILNEPLTGHSWTDYGLMLLLAIGPSCIGHTSYNYCLKYLKASTVSITILGEPLGATLLGILIFNEVPNSFMILGGIMIIIGTYVAVWKA